MLSETALHAAVDRGDCALAARLLARGADPNEPDELGRSALGVDYAGVEVLHRIRQEYQRLPLVSYPSDPECDPTIASLDRDGIVKLPGLIPQDVLRKLQREFSRFVWKIHLARLFKRFQQYDQKQYWHPIHGSYVTNDALQSIPSLLAFYLGSRISDAADRYFRKPSHVKRAYAMRYLPWKSITKSQFHWHHDMEDKQMKAMILLTDVNQDGQYMSYVRGSHSAFHPYERFRKNHLDFNYCKSYLDRIEIVNTTGNAGDVFLFDSNGMHRGNRFETSVRDAVFIEFTADCNDGNLWGTDLRHSAIPESTDSDSPTLRPFLAAQPKWERTRQKKKRRGSTWVNSLEDPSRWLSKK